MITVATLWMVNENGELLMARRSLTKASDPGVWGPSVTGRTEPNEPIDVTLAREVQEELGISAEAYEPQLILTKDFKHPDGVNRRFYIYAARFKKSITSDIKLQTEEVDAVDWFSVDSMIGLIHTAPNTLVPSATNLWPDTFEALRQAGYIPQEA